MQGQASGVSLGAVIAGIIKVALTSDLPHTLMNVRNISTARPCSYHSIKPNIQQVLQFYYSRVRILHYLTFNYSKVLDYSTIKYKHCAVNAFFFSTLTLPAVIWVVLYIAYIIYPDHSLHHRAAQSPITSVRLNPRLTSSSAGGFHPSLVVSDDIPQA